MEEASQSKPIEIGEELVKKSDLINAIGVMAVVKDRMQEDPVLAHRLANQFGLLDEEGRMYSVGPVGSRIESSMHTLLDLATMMKSTKNDASSAISIPIARSGETS